jgi:IS30 family transposase
VSKTFAYELDRKVSGCPGLSIRQVGVRMGRAPSTISRELARNRDPRTGRYQPERAGRLAWERQRRHKRPKLAANPVLRAEVQQMPDRRYCPEQVSGRLRVLYPDDPAMRVSHEIIYQGIYVCPRGELKRELKACLRSGREVRRRRGRRETRSSTAGAVPIGARPADVQGRLVPGHHEGDLILGSKASDSAVGTIVERTTGYLTLLPLPGRRDATSVADAVIEQLNDRPRKRPGYHTPREQFAKLLAEDQRVATTP